MRRPRTLRLVFSRRWATMVRAVTGRMVKFNGGEGMSLEWTSDLEIGQEVIDSQHQEIFARFRKFNTACNQGKGRNELYDLHTFLQRYIQEHFEQEEQLQRESGYPEYDAHCRDHELFRHKVAELATHLGNAGATATLVISTNLALTSWLVRHIQEKDKHFADFLAARG